MTTTAASHLRLARFAHTHIQRLAPPSTRRHPDSDSIETELRHWATTVDLYAGEDIQQLTRRQVGLIVGCCMPDVPTPIARVTAHYLAWVFAFDDTVAEHEPLLAIHQAMDLPGLLRDGATHDRSAAQGLAGVLVSVRDEIVDIGGMALLPQLAGQLGRYLDACAGEAPWRRTGRPPALAAYLHDRTATSGGHPLLLHRLMPGMPPPGAPLPAGLDSLADQAFLIGGLANDLLGFAHEQRQGDPVNVVTVLAGEYALPLPEAYRAAVILHAAHTHRFAADLVRTSGDPALAESHRALAAAIGGWVEGSAAAIEPYWQHLLAHHEDRP
ncbi:hypothetical protein BS329_20395 [Amycolatopsis coloradensis]|uniref:Terpene synthase n=1 Tax=Amycolatopsis coloradensis TaxID=76021 RepID=A0A1R0KQN1_9PSEU|nr:terpene synthase family protein [Amycolatopsis coloradensis]OLZ49995.1 hypothetical protein BS329_20395 [Amycolatopsis coloradensis]